MDLSSSRDRAERAQIVELYDEAQDKQGAIRQVAQPVKAVWYKMVVVVETLHAEVRRN